MADPIVPNFVNGVGRLATDRYTYEKHTNGTDDRHKANQIDLFPTIVIGTPQSTVQDAIAAISTVIGTPPPDASTTVKGIVKLAGDIAGTATSVVVTRLQGKPVSALTPSTGDVLTWDGSTWKPQSIVGTFTNLTVTGNTTLGTNSGNTLVVNAQTTLSNNLTVNGNTTLGNAGSDVITITGVTGITGNTTITGTLNVSSNTVIGGILNVGSSIQMSSGATANSYSSLLTTTLTSGDTVRVIAPTTLTLQAATMNVNVTNTVLTGFVKQNSGTLGIWPGASFVISSGVSTSIQSSLLMSGVAKINKKYATGPLVNDVIYPALYDVYQVSNGMTGDRQWTIDETSYPGATQGYEFEVINYNTGGHSVVVYGPSPSFVNIATVPSGMRGVFYRTASAWALKLKNYIYT